ncbi:hypothetical protein ABT236_38000 [Streptomyces sp. NPDC001523]|uniref:hypothetical protein n=1 Tax=Streptomyces sp. NPDC001523 TaxID=3154383 RepID=UPI003330EDB2
MIRAQNIGSLSAGCRFSATWGSRDVLDTTLVHPALVAEGGVERPSTTASSTGHPLRFQQLRLDTGIEDVPGSGGGRRLMGAGAGAVAFRR